MAKANEVEVEPRIFFTAPWEPVVVRRGDALGLRALTDQFADVVAPDLSNRIRDGRWITILAWCLVRSQEVFHASGGRSVETRVYQQTRYAWLRPLELMWVARTIALAKEDWRGRDLPGQRRLQPWLERNKDANLFGMTEDQFRAYRQTGLYGGYRLAFRKWPNMTAGGDGWTPGSETLKLAMWLESRLGVARIPLALHISDGADSSLSRSAKLAKDKEHDWWLRQWKNFDRGRLPSAEATLPRPKSDFKVLPEKEILKPLIFGKGKGGERRLEIARAIGKALTIDHIGVCKHLAKVFAADNIIKLLPRFSRLADAGIAAMDLVAEVLHRDSSIELAKVAAMSEARYTCQELVASARDWLSQTEISVRHIELADRFAKAVMTTGTGDCLRALLQYHEVHGGGLRWFVLRDGWIEPRTPPRASASSRYRFRLWSLCRLAAQCGVLRKMPAALQDAFEDDEEESVEASNEQG